MSDNDIDQSQAPDDAILAFKDKLLDELGAGSFSAEDKKRLEDKLESLVNTRILNLIMTNLSKEEMQKFADLAKAEKEEETVSFLRESIPSFDDKILSELMTIRDELLTKYIGENK